MPDHTFEIYRLLVEEAREARRARRELSNIFLTLNMAGVAALGFIAREPSELDPALFAWCAAALGFICLIWQTSNRYYNRSLKTKYRIITSYENKLGEKPLLEEYQAMGGSKVMRAFTLERAMPYLFVLGYVVFYLVQAGHLNGVGPWVQEMVANTMGRMSPTP
ncbi:MAG: RipA family octameric membrane protein [Vitreimonas sp.]